MTTSKMQQTLALGTDFWNDSCDPLELKAAVEAGATGATSNPSLVSAAITRDTGVWHKLLLEQWQKNPEWTEDELAWFGIHELGRQAAAILYPVFLATDGRKGKLSLQVNPKFFPSASRMIAQGQELAALAENIVIKLPAIPTGIQAMEELTSRGISVNATVSFSVAQALACAEAIERGFKRAQSQGVNTARLTPYVTLLVGRIDDHLQAEAQKLGVCLDPGLHAWGSIAVFKKAYELYTSRGYHATLLSASYRTHWQWSEFMGGKVALSIPYKFWRQFNQSDIEVRSRMQQPVDAQVIQRLEQSLPSFRTLYAENGMKPEEFLAFPGSVFTFHQFISGLEALTGTVRRTMLQG